MSEAPPEGAGEPTWPWWKLLLAALWPVLVVVAYVGLVLVPLGIGVLR